MSNLPPLNALRAFEAAGRHLNFRAAAEEMGVTQGAVAQQVRLLESHLGVAVFERQSKGVAFTAAGRAYHNRIAAAFAELRAATEVLRPEPGKVLVSVTPTFAAKWLIPNLPEFSKSHPEIDLRVLATEKTSSFHGDGIDIAVRQASPPFGAAIEAIRLFKQQIIAVAAPSFVADMTVPFRGDALAQAAKLHDAHDLWPEFLDHLGAADKSKRSLRMSQTALAIDAAVSGQGVALVSRFLVERELASGALVQVVPDTMNGAQDFYLLSQRRRAVNPAVETVKNWLCSRAEA
ncbi:LysR substrate-binding domain-containing protein [Neptunicoccus cionae]|uniref:LysR substrate-binding domain-containing protein n=1 Tax=Neptunicoccus cionae TaxID=2035344 RepID=UPI000C77DCBC|nr:LysR substrate-binding domain-containing protein [Amylibacter cionae]PLS20008.1 LysR family transcriptional regulator [Amylibacter cionae]